MVGVDAPIEPLRRYEHYFESAEPIAALLDSAAELAASYPDLARDHDREACDDYACDLTGRSIAVARALNGTEHP